MSQSQQEESGILLTDLGLNSNVRYYKQGIQVNVHHFYITTVIGEPSSYLEMINVLKTSEPHDTIFIYLNTKGGNLYTAIQIISAMRQSAATVITVLEGEVLSAGTMIFLAGHKHIVNDNCSFMIHNYSHGLGGKGNEITIQVKYTDKYFKKLSNDIYGSFLTQDEIQDVLDGKDIWMESEEVKERVKAKLLYNEEPEPFPITHQQMVEKLPSTFENMDLDEIKKIKTLLTKIQKTKTNKPD